MGLDVPADIVFRRTGPHYRATPPVFTVHLSTKPQVQIRNLTGSSVRVWAPQGVLEDTPRELAHKEEFAFTVNPELEAGAYVYTAFVVGTEDFVEGNSPPAIIIDK